MHLFSYLPASKAYAYSRDEQAFLFECEQILNTSTSNPTSTISTPVRSRQSTNNSSIPGSFSQYAVRFNT